MKKVLLMYIICIIAFAFVGCRTYNESEYSEFLNKEIRKNDNEYFEEEVAAISLDMFIRDYNENNKYLVTFEKNNDYVICGYLDNNIKEKLDKITVIGADGDDLWSVWLGYNNYIKKYNYAIANNIIEEEEYPIKWFDIKDTDIIKENYKNMFLMCKVESYKVIFKDYDTNEIYERNVLVDSNSVLSYLLNIEDTEKYKKRIVLYKTVKEQFTAYDLMHQIRIISFMYIVRDNEIYIHSKQRTEINNPNLKGYLFNDDEFNDIYYYKLKDIKDVMEGNV